MDKDWKMFEKDPETGEKKYIPGSWRKMLQMPNWQTILLVAVVVFSYFMYNAATEECRVVMERPCDYCAATNPLYTVNYTGQPVLNSSVNNEITSQG